MRAFLSDVAASLPASYRSTCTTAFVLACLGAVWAVLGGALA